MGKWNSNLENSIKRLASGVFYIPYNNIEKVL